MAVKSLTKFSSAMQRALAQNERARSTLAKIRAKGDALASNLVTTGEVVAGALIMGGIHGRYGEAHVFGVPSSLGVGIVLHAAALAGVGGRNARHLHGLGNGALAAYATTLGIGVGAKMRKDAGLPALAGVDGDFSASRASGGGVLTDAEMNKMAESV